MALCTDRQEHGFGFQITVFGVPRNLSIDIRLFLDRITNFDAMEPEAQQIAEEIEKNSALQQRIMRLIQESNICLFETCDLSILSGQYRIKLSYDPNREIIKAEPAIY